MRLPRVRFTVRRMMVASVVAAVMLGAVADRLSSTPPDVHIREWVKDHPDQPKPELVAEGVDIPGTVLLWLVIALGVGIIVAVLLWPVLPVASDLPEPE